MYKYKLKQAVAELRQAQTHICLTFVYVYKYELKQAGAELCQTQTQTLVYVYMFGCLCDPEKTSSA